MKQLLTKLQLFSKTWTKLVKYFIKTVHIKGYYDSEIKNAERILIKGFDEPIINVGIINQLLTDFCDNEGYYVVARPYYVYQANCFVWKYEITKFQLEEIEEFGNPSRQEAFNQGVIKAFSLMEERNK